MPIGTIWEGSPASRVALEVYGQTRDALLNNEDWPFARRAVGLALLKTAPVGGYAGLPWTNAYPPPQWIYEYAYPDACIYQFTADGVERVAYEDTEHYRITRSFLGNPERMLEILFSE